MAGMCSRIALNLPSRGGGGLRRRPHDEAVAGVCSTPPGPLDILLRIWCLTTLAGKDGAARDAPRRCRAPGTRSGGLYSPSRSGEGGSRRPGWSTGPGRCGGRGAPPAANRWQQQLVECHCTCRIDGPTMPWDKKGHLGELDLDLELVVNAARWARVAMPRKK